MFYYNLPVLFLLAFISFVSSSPALILPWELEPVTPKTHVLNKVLITVNNNEEPTGSPSGNVQALKGIVKPQKHDELSIQGHAEVQNGKQRTKKLRPMVAESFTVKGQMFEGIGNKVQINDVSPENIKNIEYKNRPLKGVVNSDGSQEKTNVIHKKNKKGTTGGKGLKESYPYGVLPTDSESPNNIETNGEAMLIPYQPIEKRRPKKISARPEIQPNGLTEDVPKGKNYRAEKVGNMQGSIARNWPLGIIWYKVDEASFDKILEGRVRDAMTFLESASCVQFKPLTTASDDMSWIHITNPLRQRECSHTTSSEKSGEITMILGLECLKRRDIIHSLLHAIGFKDEVAHPHRDQYIRIMWQNIRPRYQKLFYTTQEESTNPVEYDPMSIMHFHDRAFSKNGQATIVPLMPGLQIQPSDKLSQLDKMKLRLAFGHECNRRTVDDLVDSCKAVLRKEAGVDKASSNSEETNDDKSEGTGANDEEGNNGGDNEEGGDNKEGGDEYYSDDPSEAGADE